MIGSSPRVWGQECTYLVNQDNTRIIPTRMGTSVSLIFVSTVTWDHPHAYGDKAPSGYPEGVLWGSSPRVWGQERTRSTTFSHSRIIPTRMGTSQLERLSTTRRQDHPHAYGDKFYSVKNCTLCSGSSPRVWGQGR